MHHVASFLGLVAIAAFIAEAIADLLESGEDQCGVLASRKTLPAITWPHTGPGLPGMGSTRSLAGGR